MHACFCASYKWYDYINLPDRLNTIQPKPNFLRLHFIRSFHLLCSFSYYFHNARQHIKSQRHSSRASKFVSRSVEENRATLSSRWLTKQGIGAISWCVRPTGNTSQSARELLESSSIQHSLILRHFSFAAIAFPLSPDAVLFAVKFIATRWNSRIVSRFTQRRFTFLLPWETALRQPEETAVLQTDLSFCPRISCDSFFCAR